MIPLDAAPKKRKERDYSHRSLIDKLGVKELSKVSVINMHDRGFLELLRTRTPDIARTQPQRSSDLIFYEANNRQELRMLKSLKRYLKDNGAIWVVSFKGKLARIKDVDVIAAARAAGLVDNKVVGFSETHTSLKLVIPRDKRV